MIGNLFMMSVANLVNIKAIHFTAYLLSNERDERCKDFFKRAEVEMEI
jgi:hypothetical protein